MAKINWTDEAEQWIRDIYDYIGTHNITLFNIFHFTQYTLAFQA